jgi:copper chaperone NosL
MSRRVTLLIIASLVIAGCADDEMSLDPPEIRYGEDISEMGMFVVDPRYTVATLPEGSDEWLLFDDIGEFFKYHDTQTDVEFQTMWVNDYYDKTWLPAKEAVYLESREINSPMGWGIAAFREEGDAVSMQEQIGGEIMNWAAADARQWTAPPPPTSQVVATPAPSASPQRHSRH